VTNTPRRILLSWSSGKDSAWTLHLLRQDPDIEISALLTAFNGAADRVAMHAVRRELVEAQAQRTALPLWSIDLPWPCSNAVYENLMRETCQRALKHGITAIAFGDLFLQDIRDYRERQMESTGLSPLFPVWQIPTNELAGELISIGMKAKVTCIDLAKLDASYAGREYDCEFLSSLPPGVDSCGENGEFHTFVYDGPVFSSGIRVKVGEKLERDGFVFADVMPALDLLA
jgi:uncharacterized protein (TIGR00290 family)